MKIKKDWFGMFSSTREYARSIYVREPTEEADLDKKDKNSRGVNGRSITQFFVLFISAVRYAGNFGWLCGETAGTRAVFGGYG